jgi:hypothetical protein
MVAMVPPTLQDLLAVAVVVREVLAVVTAS